MPCSYKAAELKEYSATSTYYKRISQTITLISVSWENSKALASINLSKPAESSDPFRPY